MKHKADIGRCAIAKRPVEVEPGAVPHSEDARRMSPEKAERANQEVRNLLRLVRSCHRCPHGQVAS